jgi:hypothetical protein
MGEKITLAVLDTDFAEWTDNEKLGLVEAVLRAFKEWEREHGGGDSKWPIGTTVFKTQGSSWHGKVVGYYSTVLTPDGYCVESDREPGSVHIYPRSALAALGTAEKEK